MTPSSSPQDTAPHIHRCSQPSGELHAGPCVCGCGATAHGAGWLYAGTPPVPSLPAHPEEAPLLALPFTDAEREEMRAEVRDGQIDGFGGDRIDFAAAYMIRRYEATVALARSSPETAPPGFVPTMGGMASMADAMGKQMYGTVARSSEEGATAK